MKSGIWTLLLLVAVPIVLLAGAACGDDDDDDDGGAAATSPAAAGTEDLEAYFDDLAAIQSELNEGVEIIDERSQQAFVDPAAARQTLNAVSDAGQAALGDLKDLEVPPDAADAHAGLESAGEAYLSAVDSLADELQSIEGGAEYDAWLASIEEPDSEYTQAKAELQDACTEMLNVAAENDIDTDVECPV